ncbi:MAG TPA: EcsC family protein [Xanthobacteraceae bacterium]|jgi:hypothetical protein
MTEQDLEVLRTAVELLENASLASRLTSIIGKPIELIGLALPAGASSIIAAATTKGLNAALKVALRTMENRPEAASRLLHKALATASGAVGGSLGLMTAPLELPISTIIMLRSIADIARSEGENLADPDAALSCVQVFALGARSGSVDAAESGYFVARGVLAKSITEAARFITERGVVEEGAPIVVRFIAQVASRFGVVVTQKLAAQTLPIVGALGGAAVNYAFVDHFQDVARGHFAIRRLERTYGKEIVRAQYERIRAAPKAASLPSEAPFHNGKAPP